MHRNGMDSCIPKKSTHCTNNETKCEQPVCCFCVVALKTRKLLIPHYDNQLCSIMSSQLISNFHFFLSSCTLASDIETGASNK